MLPEPFPHLVLDDWWDSRLLDACFLEFDRIAEESWFQAEVSGTAEDGVITLLESKKSIDFRRCQELGLSAAVSMLNRLSSPVFVSFLELTTGIPDLHFDFLGGGLHRIVPGGLLAEHIDFNVDDAGRWRRVNVLIYLSGCNGGALRLSNAKATITKLIVPRANRMVIFNCSETSWHGHPVPLGEGRDRRSLAAYYFTREPPPDAAAPHHTIFRPSESK